MKVLALSALVAASSTASGVLASSGDVPPIPESDGGDRILSGDDSTPPMPDGRVLRGRELQYSCDMNPQPDATWQDSFTNLGYGICSAQPGVNTNGNARLRYHWRDDYGALSHASCGDRCLQDDDCYGFYSWKDGNRWVCGLYTGCTYPIAPGPWNGAVNNAFGPIEGVYNPWGSDYEIYCFKRDMSDPVAVCDPTWGCRKGGMELYDSSVSASTEDGVRFTKLGWTDDLRTVVSAGALGVDAVHTVEFTLEKLVHKADAYVGITKECYKDLGEVTAPGTVMWWGAAWLIAYDSNGNKTNQRLDHDLFGWTQGTKVQMVVDLINDTVTFFLVTNNGLVQAGEPIDIDHEPYHFAASIDHTKAEVAVNCA